MSKKNSFVCCICGTKCYGFGNNPNGAVWKDDKGNLAFPTFEESERCCDLCNDMFVVPGRMYKIMKERKNG